VLVLASCQNDTSFERKVRDAYKTTGDAIESNKMFSFKRVPKKGLTDKFKKLKVVKRVNGFLYYKQMLLYLFEGKIRIGMI
jgi:hypothetical protein